MPQTRLCSMTITSPISASRMARAASCTDAVPGSATGLGVISSRICCAIRYSFCGGSGLGHGRVRQDAAQSVRALLHAGGLLLICLPLSPHRPPVGHTWDVSRAPADPAALKLTAPV